MNRSSRSAIAVLAASLVLCAAEVRAERARACACAPVLELTPKQAGRLTQVAEKLLAAGQDQQAFELLNQKLADDGRGAYGFAIPPGKIGQNLQRVWAVVRLRGGGSEEVQAAVVFFREQLQLPRYAEDPWLTTRLAEALYRSGEETKLPVALGLLETLDKRSQIADPEGLATLARLRRQTGDTVGSQTALERCRVLTQRPGVCSNEPLPPPREPTSPRGLRTLD